MIARPGTARTVGAEEMPDRLAARLRTLDPRLLDASLALVLLASSLYVAYQSASLVPVHALILALVFLPLAVRRTWPIAVTWLIGLALLINLALGFSDSFFENFAMLLALYTVAADARRGLPFVVTLAGVAVGLQLGIAIDWHNHGRVYLADLSYNWLLFAVPVIVGYGVRTRRAYIAQLEERQRLVSREAAAEERNRIARELHDVVSHSVSVMVLQAAAGARVARRDPAEAVRAFDVIQATGRQALAEGRRALGALRAGEDAPASDLAPQPGLEQLEDLAQQVRRTGLGVDLKVQGEPRPLGSGVEVSVYRIVQESLTNVLKHAHAAHAAVLLTYEDTELRLEISDDGRGLSRGAAPGGHGLLGMRERVRVLGGELQAGPVDGGYRVCARLPVEAAAR
jgi:signal transduction histidine kinase